MNEKPKKYSDRDSDSGKLMKRTLTALKCDQIDLNDNFISIEAFKDSFKEGTELDIRVIDSSRSGKFVKGIVNFSKNCGVEVASVEITDPEFVEYLKELQQEMYATYGVHKSDIGKE